MTRLDYNRDLFLQQKRFHPYILGMVMLLVGSGLWFSYLQFTLDKRAMAELQKLASLAKELPPDDPLRPLLLAKADLSAQRSTQSFEFGPVKMSSPVIGLVVLAMSLAFFFVYVDRVYTIHPESSSQPIVSSQAPADISPQSSEPAPGAESKK